MAEPLVNAPDAPDRVITTVTADRVQIMDFVRLPDDSWTDGEVAATEINDNGSLTFVLTSADIDPTQFPSAIPKRIGPYNPTAAVVVSTYRRDTPSTDATG